jgi:hypothetical protein
MKLFHGRASTSKQQSGSEMPPPAPPRPKGSTPVKISAAAIRTAEFKHQASLRELEAEARYASDRFRLYRARSYGHPTNPSRLRELEREAEHSRRRLERARADGPRPT